MLRILARLIVVAAAIWASQAIALGLGDIAVKSKLDQPFAATIPVLGATPGQLDSLSVQLAGADEFKNSGIERSNYLSSLKFVVQAAPDGANVVISSDKAAREPFLNFIVEVHSANAKLLREYTVLLDPPGMSDQQASAAPEAPAASSPPADTTAPAMAEAAPAASPETAAAAESPVKPHSRRSTSSSEAAAAAAVAADAPSAEVAESSPPAVASADSNYGPTAAQETFWSIAAKLRPGLQVSMDQVLLAIYRANPHAFDRGSFNGLLKGQMLRVPSLAEMQKTTAAQAKFVVDAWRHGRRPGSSGPSRDAGAPAGAAAAEIAPTSVGSATKNAAKPAVEASPLAPAAAAVVAQTPAAAPAAAPRPAAVTQAAPALSATNPNPAVANPAPAAAPEVGKTQTADTAPPVSADVQQTAQTPPAAPQKNRVVPTPAPVAAPGLFEDSTTQWVMAILAIVLVLALGWFIFRRRKVPMPDFGARAPVLTPASPSPSYNPKPVKKAGPPSLSAKPVSGGVDDATVLKAEKPPAIAPKRDRTRDPGRGSATSELPLAEGAAEQAKQTTKTNAPTLGGGQDFGLTSHSQAPTAAMKLEASDPLSEADFHLAYGLHDEAVSLLKQALAKQPKRQDLRMKLAESYFASGRAMEFQETAESLQGKVSPAEWQKVATMGRQLCPDSALFKSDAAVVPAQLEPSRDSTGSAPASAPATGSAAALRDQMIDFDLDSELSRMAPAAPATAAAAVDNDKLDFDLSHFDLSDEPPHAAAGGEGTVEFNLDELDLSKPIGEGLSSGDEIGTKFDLARVYADMGDNEAARGLLSEVMETGNAAQKVEAEALIKRLSA